MLEKKAITEAVMTKQKSNNYFVQCLESRVFEILIIFELQKLI